MRTFYKRDLNNNYLVLEGKNENLIQDFQWKMISNNPIESILPMTMRQIEGKYFYYYEINSLQPISRILREGNVNILQLEKIILQLEKLFRVGNEYLLEPENFIIEPDYIFCDIETLAIKVVFNMDYTKDIHTRLRELAEYFLEQINHEDKAAVFFGYQMYKITRKEHFLFEEIVSVLENTDIDSKKMCNPVEHPQEIECEEPYVVRNLTENNQTLANLMQGSIDKIDKAKIEEEEGKQDLLKKLGLVLIKSFLSILFLSLFSMGFILKLYFADCYIESILCVAIGAIGIFSILLTIIASKIKGKTEDCSRTFEYKGTSTYYKNLSNENLDKKASYDPREWNLETKVVQEENAYGNTVFLGMTLCEEQRMLKGIIKGKEITFSLQDLPATIGKSKDNVDIVINHPSVSRIHARFFEEAGELFLQDQNSTNGTYKNGLPLDNNEVVSVKIKDEIMFGNVMFTYY